MTGALVAYVHYVAMVFIALLLVFELQACVPGLPAARMRHLARVDLLYMAAAVLALATGVLRVVWFGQGAGFYLHNPVFYIKLALFAAVGLLSIPPTLQYLRWMRALRSGGTAFAEPWQVTRVRRYLVAQLVLFALIPLMAVLMARGIGIQAASS
jgi:putative membrane protein